MIGSPMFEFKREPTSKEGQRQVVIFEGLDREFFRLLGKVDNCEEGDRLWEQENKP
jgi:hypothetical protein